MAEQWRSGSESWESDCLLGRDGSAVVSIDGEQFAVGGIELNDGELRFSLNGKQHALSALANRSAVDISDGLQYLRASKVEEGEASETQSSGGANSLHSQMPGRVLALTVEPGAEVAKGQVLLILEAMKMEHEVLAPSDGTVTGFPLQQGARVMPGDLLVNFEPRA